MCALLLLLEKTKRETRTQLADVAVAENDHIAGISAAHWRREQGKTAPLDNGHGALGSGLRSRIGRAGRSARSLSGARRGFDGWAFGA